MWQAAEREPIGELGRGGAGQAPAPPKAAQLVLHVGRRGRRRQLGILAGVACVGIAKESFWNRLNSRSPGSALISPRGGGWPCFSFSKAAPNSGLGQRAR